MKNVRKYKDPENLTFKDLKEIPLVNIIIPAWNEGKEFQDLLYSIKELKYPRIKAIVNAGGDKKTIEIAESFKDSENFIILRQMGGSNRAEMGKIKALNDCIDYVSEGIIFFTDADCYITDEIIVRLIYPIISNKEHVVVGAGTRPLLPQEKNDLVQYLNFTREGFSRRKFQRYSNYMIAGAVTCLTYEAIKKIGKFNQNQKIAEDISRGQDLLAKGFKIYCLTAYESRIYTDFPSNFKELITQRKRYSENALLYAYKNKRIMPFIKFIGLICMSTFFLFLPIFLFYNLGLFFIGLSILFFLYFRKIRKLIFFRIIVDKNYFQKINKVIFIKIVFYIFIEIFTNVLTLIELIRYKKIFR